MIQQHNNHAGKISLSLFRPRPPRQVSLSSRFPSDNKLSGYLRGPIADRASCTSFIKEIVRSAKSEMKLKLTQHCGRAFLKISRLNVDVDRPQSRYLFCARSKFFLEKLSTWIWDWVFFCFSVNEMESSLKRYSLTFRYNNDVRGTTRLLVKATISTVTHGVANKINYWKSISTPCDRNWRHIINHIWMAKRVFVYAHGDKKVKLVVKLMSVNHNVIEIFSFFGCWISLRRLHSCWLH